MKFRYVFGLCLHLTLLAVCITTVTAMTMIKSFIRANRDAVLSSTLVDIYGLQLQPDLGVGVHALILAVAMFIPSLTGLYYTCICNGKKEHSKSFRKNLRIAHVIFLVVGLIATSVLFFSQVGSLVDGVNCHILGENCECNGMQRSNNVCAVRELRYAYISFLIIHLVGLILGMLFASTLVPLPDHWCARVAQDPGSLPDNRVQGSVPPNSSEPKESTVK